MSNGPRPVAHGNARGYATRKRSPMIEVVESRLLLDGGFGVISGTAFLDTANDHVLGVNSPYLQGATIQLYQPGNGTPIATAVTDAHGGYTFSDLAPGNYFVREVPPAGYQASGAQAFSQVNSSIVAGPDTILVNVPANPIYVKYSGVKPGGYQVLNNTINGTPTTDSVGQLQVALGTTPGATDVNPGFLTFCINDLQRISFQGGEIFPVDTRPITEADSGFGTIPADRAGRIAFLYNHYGNTTLNNITSPALQLAIWELAYDTGATPDFSSGVFQVVSPVNPPTDQAALDQVLQQATAYFNLSAGKSESAIFLDAGTPATSPTGYQSMIATGSYNFGNVAFCPSSLSGYVYCDANHDGARDAGDGPVVGSVITLTGTTDSGTRVNLNVMSDQNGAYQFANLQPGVYTITQTGRPAGLLPGSVNQGTPGSGTVVNESIRDIRLDSCVNGQNNNFGDVGQAVNVTRLQMLGIHHQPTRVILTLDGPVDAAGAQDPANYYFLALGANPHLGSPTNHRVPIASAAYDPTAGTVTLTTRHHLNVHDHYLLSTNIPGTTACNPPVRYTTVFGRSAVPTFTIHGVTVPAPPLSRHQQAYDALIARRALARWDSGRYDQMPLKTPGNTLNRTVRQNGFLVLNAPTGGAEVAAVPHARRARHR